MVLTHCSRMMASWAAFRASLLLKSTPSKVGGTWGFWARNAADSGVGMADVRVLEITDTEDVDARQSFDGGVQGGFEGLGRSARGFVVADGRHWRWRSSH